MKHLAVPRASLAGAARLKGESPCGRVVSKLLLERCDTDAARRLSPSRRVDAHSFDMLDRSDLEEKLLQFEAGRLRWTEWCRSVRVNKPP